IGENVTSIGDSAFRGCTALTEINYNATAVTSSNTDIFSNAGTAGSGITVNIGSSVTSIPAKLFNSFLGPKVTTLNIGENVTSIGDSAFRGCTALTEINYNAKELTTALTDSSEIFYNAGTAGSGITVNIGSGVTLIPDYLFEVAYVNCRPNVAILNIGENVTSIGKYAFSNITGITSIIIPENVISIGEKAFADCTALSITIPASITSIGRSAFFRCSKLTELNYNATRLTTALDYSDGIFGLAGVDGNGITVNIGANVASIPAYLFKANNVASPKIIAVNFAEGSVCTEIRASAFETCTSLISINLPAGLTNIGSRAFYCCSNLTDIIIPEGLTSIGDGAFVNCGSICFTVAENNANYSSDAQGVLYNKNKTILIYGSAVEVFIVPETVVSIASGAFSGVKSLSSISIPSNVTSIDGYAFGGCGNISFTVAEDNANYSSDTQGALYNKNKTTLIRGSGVETFIVPDTVAVIGSNAFDDYTNLKRITIPSSVSYINSYAFRGCISLISITIPAVVSIGIQAFCDCMALTSITIPASVTSIDGSAFSGCYALAEVYDLSPLDIVAGNMDNGDVAYYAKVIHTTLDASTRILEENGVKYYVYDGEKIALCPTDRNATTITLAEDCTKINQYAFAHCTALTEINYNAVAVTSSTSNIFYNAGTAGSGITVNIGSSVKSIPAYLFYVGDSIYKPNVTTINIGENVTSIGSFAFSGCSALKTIVVEAHEGATAVASYSAYLPTISGYTWYVYEGDSTEGTQVTTTKIQYYNVKYTYKAVANS
ncbi:MAG: leucine-rich repeat domain-containing protein, partial [Clostridia bacterium]|nr:leucine-rich repeat domain-containing protein [Clostridia bacterium]